MAQNLNAPGKPSEVTEKSNVERLPNDEAKPKEKKKKFKPLTDLADDLQKQILEQQSEMEILKEKLKNSTDDKSELDKITSEVKKLLNNYETKIEELRPQVDDFVDYTKDKTVRIRKFVED